MENYDRIIQKQREYFMLGKTKDAHFRMDALEKIEKYYYST